MAMQDYTIKPGDTPQSIERRRRIAQELARQGMDYSPIRSPWQGLARVSSALLGGYEEGQADKTESAGQARAQAKIAAALAGNDNTSLATALSDPFTPDGGRQALGMVFQSRQHAVDQAQAKAIADRQFGLADKELNWKINAKDETFRPLVTPQERAQFGIPETDKNLYQIGVKSNKIVPVTASGTTINNNLGQTNEFAKKNDQEYAESYSAIAKNAQQAKVDLALTGELERVLSGAPEGIRAGLLDIGNRFGVNFGNGSDQIQAARTLIDRLTPAQRQGLPGAASDRDVAMFQGALPQLWGTAQGRQLAIETMRAMAEHRIREGQIANLVRSGKMTPQQGEGALLALPDPFKLLKERTGKKQTDIFSQADALVGP